MLLRIEVPWWSDVKVARHPPPKTNASESEAESSITGTREPSPIFAQPVPNVGDEDLNQPEELPSEEEEQETDPTYIVPRSRAVCFSVPEIDQRGRQF